AEGSPRSVPLRSSTSISRSSASTYGNAHFRQLDSRCCYPGIDRGRCLTLGRERMSKFDEQYSERGFWEKVKRFAKAMGVGVLKPALQLYYSAQDPDTPASAKAIIYGALGYLITPIDAIPDLT